MEFLVHLNKETVRILPHCVLLPPAYRPLTTFSL